MFPFLFSIWGCIPEISKDCTDMTNASSTYLGIIAGTIIGAVISWWIYYRQKKISQMQDRILSRIKELEESHGEILKNLQVFDDKNEKPFEQIIDLERNINSVFKKFEPDTNKKK